MALNRDLKEFLQLLVKHDVEFMLVGAHAVAVHGFPRNTEDIDFWIRRDRANAVKVMAALTEFGFGDLDLKVEDLLDENTVIQLGKEPHRIDLLTFLTGLDFEDCIRRKFDAIYDGVPISVIGREDLLKNKRATGRSKDKGDVEAFDNAERKSR